MCNHQGLLFIERLFMSNANRCSLLEYIKTDVSKSILFFDECEVKASKDTIDFSDKDCTWYLKVTRFQLNRLCSFIELVVSKKHIMTFNGTSLEVVELDGVYLNRLKNDYLDKDICIVRAIQVIVDGYIIGCSYNNPGLVDIYLLIEEYYSIMLTWSSIQKALDENNGEEFGFNSEIYFKVVDNEHLGILDEEDAKVIYVIHKNAFYNLAKTYQRCHEEIANLGDSKVIMIVEGKNSSLEFID